MIRVNFFPPILSTFILPMTGCNVLLHTDKHQNRGIAGADHICCVDKATAPNKKYYIWSNKVKAFVRYRLKSYHLIEFAGKIGHQSAVAHEDFCNF